MYKFIFGVSIAIFFILACSEHTETSGFQITGTREIKSENQLDSSLHNVYSWRENYKAEECLVNRIKTPEGYSRVPVKKGSFEDWLRHLPLKEPGEKVKFHDGTLKYRQDVHHAIIDIDAGGKEDLQQCADACMRLRAEYLYSIGAHDKIEFRFTSGDIASWKKWSGGYRPVIKGNKVSWNKTANADKSYNNFKAYLKTVFTYCGTYSLNKEMKAIAKDSMKAGDLFIKGGFPGHAVIVLDMAEKKASGEKVFLIAQSYMPAQDIHILKNFNSGLSPWYSLNFKSVLETPEWTFEERSLKRF